MLSILILFYHIIDTLSHTLKQQQQRNQMSHFEVKSCRDLKGSMIGQFISAVPE